VRQFTEIGDRIPRFLRTLAAAMICCGWRGNLSALANDLLDQYLTEHLANHREPLPVRRFTEMGNRIPRFL
jgi:hypothetical protein